MRNTLALTSLLVLTACGAAEEKTCTLAGCGDHLTLNLSTPAGGPLVDIVGTVRLDGLPTSVDCDVQGAGTAPCAGPGTLTFTDTTPVEILVDLHNRTNTLEVVTTVSPTYSETAPNGPECGPICRQANESIGASPI